jgi:hypothetical protein
MPSNPESKRGQVRAVFEDKGDKAAIAKGASLGVAESRVRRWIKKWTVPDLTTAPVVAIRPPKKGLVFFIGRPDCFGKVTKKGKTESEVAWLNGNVTTVKNEWVQPVETGE